MTKKYYIIFLLLLINISIVFANVKDIKPSYSEKNFWNYNFNPRLIEEIKIYKKDEIKIIKPEEIKYYNSLKKNKNGTIYYNGTEREIGDFSKECYNIDLKQRNNENLITQLPNGCYMSLVDKDENHGFLIYLCSNKGCEKRDEPFECIENDERDCGF